MNKNKSNLCRDYCSRHLFFQRCKSFDEVIQKLQELSEKHSTDDFDEVVVSVFFGVFLYFPNKMPTLYFSQRSLKKDSNSEQQQFVILYSMRVTDIWADLL